MNRRRDSRCSQNLLGKHRSRCCYILWTRQEKDGHFVRRRLWFVYSLSHLSSSLVHNNWFIPSSSCRISSQAIRQDTIWFRCLNSSHPIPSYHFRFFIIVLTLLLQCYAITLHKQHKVKGASESLRNNENWSESLIWSMIPLLLRWWLLQVMQMDVSIDVSVIEQLSHSF